MVSRVTAAATAMTCGVVYPQHMILKYLKKLDISMSVCRAVAGIQPHFLFGIPAVRFVGTLQANHLEYQYFFDKCGPGWSEDDVCQGVD